MPYIGGVPVYRRICEEIAAEGYKGFLLGGGVEPATRPRAGPLYATSRCLSARLRSWGSRWRFLRRMLLGVTSTRSSSAM